MDKESVVEFSVTYGWAILVVLAALGALAYFGMLNPPDVCEGQGDDFFQAQAKADAGVICDSLNTGKTGSDSLDYESIFFMRDLRALENTGNIFINRDGLTTMYSYKTDFLNNTRVLFSVECRSPVLVCSRACNPVDSFGCMCYRLVLRNYLNSTDLELVGYSEPGIINKGAWKK